MNHAGHRLLRAQAESALAELVAAGRLSADSFGGLRALLMPLQRKRKLAARGRRAAQFGLEEAGRWSLIHRLGAPAAPAGTCRAGRAQRIRSLVAVAPLWRRVPPAAGA
jgi:ATP-dependent Lhr-like helicase